MVLKYFEKIVITELPDSCVETNNNVPIDSKYCMQLIVENGVAVPFMFADSLEEFLPYLKAMEKSTYV
ncbi:hypothetical protein [Brasilonema bromeliae]|uniref:Uncharacterized protein n=1 Tax=Brasilonema bromeliae SPC951 TaxID=385972 RepID=A0ABX1P3L5_9CYAN|nr:hypothetical protein [Brasilonema bromeliae]NMG18618.1 hypothetical protein [Brasilonema bromeliae SPC951]